MNSVRKLIEELKKIEETCLGDEIINTFEIKIYDDRSGSYVFVKVSNFGIEVNWTDLGK